MTMLDVTSKDFGNLAADLLQQGLPVRFRVSGQSMTPCICAGDTLTVVPVSAERLRIGDVALYRRPDGDPVAHRIVRRALKNRDRLYMTGDAQTGYPESVSAEAILGRVVSVERKGKVRPLDRRGNNLIAVWRTYGRRLLHRLRRVAGRCRTPVSLQPSAQA
jgi:hypothetical protein